MRLLVFLAVLLLLTLVIIRCTTAQDAPAITVTPTPTVTPVAIVTQAPAATVVQEDLPTPNPAEMSDADYQMYNEIMDALYAEPYKTEDEIFQGLSPTYGLSVDELRQFMNDNMEAAIRRSMGRTQSSAINAPDFATIAHYVQESLDATLGGEIVLSNAEHDWQIETTGVRYIIATDAMIDGKTKGLVVKLEFSDDYSQYTMLQLKVDGANVDL